MQAQDEAKAAQYQEWTCRTRRSNKEVNHKQKKMIKTLEKNDTTPIKDLPIDEEAEADWSHSSMQAKKPAQDLSRGKQM